MAVLKYKDPTTQQWVPLSTGGGTSKIIFGYLATFPAVGETDTLYIDQATNLIYRYDIVNGYVTSGDGSGSFGTI